MDDTAGVVVEFKEREAFAVLCALHLARGLIDRDPVGFAALVEGLRPGVFVGRRQWHADALVAGMRVWRALGLSGDAPAG